MSIFFSCFYYSFLTITFFVVILILISQWMFLPFKKNFQIIFSNHPFNK